MKLIHMLVNELKQFPSPTNYTDKLSTSVTVYTMVPSGE